MSQPSNRAGFFVMRESSSSRGYNWKWRNYRVRFLREHPLCADHQARGILVAATVVDHIIPHRGDELLFWDTKNHQALCTTCHSSAKQREERSGVKPGCNDKGIPLDAKHHWNKG